MIDIIGNIKVDEDNPERIKYLIACIRSYGFLIQKGCGFILGIDCSPETFDIIVKETASTACLLNLGESDYGSRYKELMIYGLNDYIINFMEDHFMVCDDFARLQSALELAKKERVDVIKSSFFHVERNSLKDWVQLNNYPHYGSIYDNTDWNHKQYQKYYGKRYYIGVNFITSREFALKFWNREIGRKPHFYEIVQYSRKWEHRTMVPNFEIQASIDDDHGEPNTCLLKRTDCEKWNRIWGEVQREYSYLTSQTIL